MNNELYYIRNAELGYCGNYYYWWAENHQYIPNLDLAKNICKDKKWEYYRCCDIDQFTHRVFDHQSLHKID